MKSSCVALALAVATAPACCRPARTAADLVITRANVWTGDAATPDAMCIEIVADRIRR
jgi:hypothetical protein